MHDGSACGHPAGMLGAAATSAAGQQAAGMSPSTPAAVGLPLSAAADSGSTCDGCCGRVPAAAKQAERGSGRETVRFPCCPSRRHRLHTALTSPQVRAAVQFVAGQLAINLFVFVRPVTFTQACLSSLFYGAIVIVVNPDQTLGGRVVASASIAGCGWIGLLMTGAALGLARAPGKFFTLLACVWVVVGHVFCAILRGASDHEEAEAGVVVQLWFGIGCLLGQFVAPAGALWKDVILQLLMVAGIASSVNILAGAFIFPQLASEVLRERLSVALRGAGHSVTGYASALFECARDLPCSASYGPKAQVAQPGNFDDPWVDRDRIRAATDPARQRRLAATRPPYLPRASDLRPVLQEARMAAEHAAYEPPFLMTSSLAGWRRVIDALDAVLTRVACLESALEGATGEARLLRLATLQQQSSLGVMPVFQLIFAHFAASCDCVATAVRDFQTPDESSWRLHVLGSSWGALEARLAAALHEMFTGTVESMPWDDSSQVIAFRHMPEVRSVFFVAALAGGIMEAMAHLEIEIATALRRKPGSIGPVTTAAGAPKQQIYRPEASVGAAASWGTVHSPTASQRTFDLDGSRRGTPWHSARSIHPSRRPRTIRERGSRGSAASSSSGSGSSSSGSSSSSSSSSSDGLPNGADAAHDTSGGAGDGGSSDEAAVAELADTILSETEAVASGSSHEGDSDSSSDDAGELVSLLRNTDTLEGMNLRPLQNMPMATFIKRSRSHPSSRDPNGWRSASDDESWRRIDIVQDASDGEAAEAELSTSPALAGSLSPAAGPPADAEDPSTHPRPRCRAAGRRRRRRRRKQDAALPEAGQQDCGHLPAPDRPASRLQLARKRLRRWAAWSRLLANGLLVTVAFRRWHKVLCRTMLELVRHPKATWRRVIHDRHSQFGVKFFVACAIAIVLVLALQARVPILRDWRLLYGYFTIVVVLSEKVETTVSKGLIRVSTTALGGAAAVAVLAHPAVATNPYLLTALLLAFDFCVCLFMLSTFKYAVFLMVVTFNGLVLCLYVPCGNASAAGCHLKAAIHPFYAQTAVVATAMLGVLAFNFIKPWYASDAALELLGTAFQESARLMLTQYQAACYVMAAHAGSTALKAAIANGAAPLQEHWLQERIAQPLVEVQQTLASETVVWRRGILVMPPAIHELLEAALVLLDKLAAMDLVLRAKPIVAGRYSAVPWTHYMQPLVPDFTVHFAAVARLGEVTGSFLRRRGGATAEDVRAAIAGLDDIRLAMRKRQREVMQRYYTLVRVDTRRAAASQPSASSSGDSVEDGDGDATGDAAALAAAVHPTAAAAVLRRRRSTRGAAAASSAAPHSSAAEAGTREDADSVAAPAAAGQDPAGREAAAAAATGVQQGPDLLRGGVGAAQRQRPTSSCGSTEAQAAAPGGTAAAAAAASATHCGTQPLQQPSGGSIAGRTPDDHMRFSSFSFACTEEVDKLTLMARLALEHEAVITDRRHWLASPAWGGGAR